MHAEKITKRAARVGFDWAKAADVVDKIREETAEVEHALASGEHDKIEEEIGDLLFAVTNLARKTKVEPEVALRRATGKFISRFHKVEAVLEARGKKAEECSLEELDAIWDEVKRG
jgi:ATP diphosphatase